MTNLSPIKTKNIYVNRYTCPKRVSENNSLEMMINLNNRQKQFVMHVLNCYKIDKLPYKIFLSGSAGVGKSTVVNTLYQLITNYYDNLVGGNIDKIIVLLCAPSGKAAFLINGVTLDTAFALPCRNFGSDLAQLSSDTANTIRAQLSNIQLVIIDEISMVSCTMLNAFKK